MGSSGTTNQQKKFKDVRSSFMKEVNTITYTLSISNGGGVTVSPFVIAVDNYRRVVQLELGCTVGIDHPQPNEDCVVDNSPCP